MSDGERLACMAGALLLSFATVIMLWNDSGETRPRRRRRSSDPPVDALAEELKEAWAGFHTR